MGRDVHPARFIDGAHRELGCAGGVQLAHQHEVELASQPAGQHRADRHGAPRDGQHQRMLPAVAHQRFGELFGSG
jgi:hypothetical protein